MTTRNRPWGVALVAWVLLGTTSVLADGPGGLTGEELPSDGTLYSVNQITGELITIDPNTAAIGVVGPTGFNLVEGLTYHTPTDSFFAVDNDSNQLIAIDRYTGAGTAIGPIGHDHVFGLTYSEASDTLHAVDTLENDLLTVDPTTGETSFYGPAVFDFVGGLSDHPETGDLYGVDYGSDQVFSVAFDEMGFGFIGPIVDAPGTAMQGLAYDPTIDELFALSIEVGPEDLLRIDPLTDTVHVVGQLPGVSVASLEFVPHGVPEPSSLGLLVLAAGLVHRRVRKT